MSCTHPEVTPRPTPVAGPTEYQALRRINLRRAFSSCNPSLLVASLLLLFTAVAPPILSAQDSPEIIRQKLEAEYPLTKTTAGRDDIVTAGAVLVLEKDGLEMSTVASPAVAQNNYKGGKLSKSGATQWGKAFSGCKIASLCPHSDQAGQFRTFVAGEKFWVTKVEVRDDGVVLSFFSDPISDVRYISTLKFPYDKGSQHSAAAMVATVAEVIKVQPSDDAKAADPKPASGNAPAPASGPAAPAQQYAAIPPPPPPPDAPPPAPKTVALGQSKDQVVAMFGNPTRILDKGATKIYVYPDMKVTFKADKVSDIQ